MSVFKPTTREEFKERILTELGKPVIQINIADVQVELVIEEALKWFWEWHHSGSHHVYYMATPTETDIQNRYIKLPDEISGVVEVYSLRNQTLIASYTDLLAGGYDMMMEIAYSSSGSLISYVNNVQHYELMQQLITGQTQVRYNYLDNNLYIDTNWIGLGQTYAVEAYARVDPDTTPTIWQDRWLIKYAVAKAKEIWGNNLSKYSGMSLPGNITFNGKEIQAEAKAELKEIEDNYHDYAMPVRDFIG